MSKDKHLYRRGNVFYFRVSVPERFRPLLQVREIAQSLQTQNYKEAIPDAYKLAGEAKKLFNCIDRLIMSKNIPNDFDEDALLDEVLNEIEKADNLKKNSGLSLLAKMKLRESLLIEIQTPK